MRFRGIATIFLGLAMVLALSSAVHSDAWDKTTTVTFAAPVEVPGAVLQAGTYVLKLGQSSSNRHVVQIYNADHTKLITTILAIPNERLQLSGKTVLTYSEHASDQPAALEAWFYPGDNFGQQFVYPRSEALQLARLNNEEVPSTGSEEAYPQNAQTQASSTQNIQPSESQPQNPAPRQAQNEPVPAVQSNQSNAAQTSSAPANPASNPGPALAQNNTPQTEQKLPATASSEPLIAVIGFALILAALILRRWQRA